MTEKGKVILRAIEPTDLEILYNWENNQTLWYLSNTQAPFSKYVLTKYIESAHLDIYQTRQLRLMIDVAEKNKPRTVGAIDLFDFEPQHLRAGVGILIGETGDRRNGYADAALAELIEYAFTILQVKQIFCNILTSNEASINLFKKHGFKLIGIKKAWVKINHEFVDEAMYQLVR